MVLFQTVTCYLTFIISTYKSLLNKIFFFTTFANVEQKKQKNLEVEF